MTVVAGNIAEHIICEKAIDKVYSKKFGSSRMMISKDGQESKSEFWKLKTIENKIL
jgi:hypothetical protein